ncbi:MAG: IscS subfamily cysteine desulfurase [Patescibacteria group bacterium]
MPKIYLDYAATTPVAPQVFKTIQPYFCQKFGNPASLHSFGQEALKAVDFAREKVAKFLNCQIQEIIFTSGTTESNNLAIAGVIAATSIKKPHIITTKIEHHSILEPLKYLEKHGCDVTYLSVDKEGVLNKKSVQQALKENTILVSIIYANNEIGTVQPIAEVGELIKKENEKRQKQGRGKIIFHTDAVQAIEYLNCNVQALGVDLLSFSGHKIYGPKGIGVLYIKQGTKIKKIQRGGSQEYYMRAGTLNVPGIVGLGKAIELIQSLSHKKEIIAIKKLRDKLIEGITKTISGTRLNGSKNLRLPNNANLSFAKIEGESILLHLDFEGIAVSTGSACASGSLEPSHVLLALGLSHEQAHGSIRFTLGRDTTEREINYLLKILPKIIKKLRKMSPIK